MITIEHTPQLPAKVRKEVLTDLLTYAKIKTERRVFYALRTGETNDEGKYYWHIYSKSGEYIDGRYAEDIYELTRWAVRVY